MITKALTNWLTKAFNGEEEFPKLEKPFFSKAGGHGIIFFNDETTPMDFVTGVFRKYLKLNQSQAFSLMAEIHENGEATWFGTDLDIAESICALITSAAEDQGFPFKCTVVAPEKLDKA
ncbi:ATP-dependent Clp protease adaptor ClpS [Pseudomonas sp. SL4(2022)]|uniref:ATP-dependent Clp protease adaptor ClpS n=1 Tax=Pseudomonas sp. SL4(2022) TaxID=2994661 RepID=UPI00226F9872|nr:ATP-dependent Clp protease adaptor ClpS [Pseudomonas sp. SL4(2022)]WAC43842.1 ATP-dependent Clp protease adaptor ClpS [Pseudomonas sp. SL4(2022)]